MKERLLLIRPAEQNVDGSRPVFTPPLGLWSMRTNNFGRPVEVVDKAVREDPTRFETQWVGYSVLFPAHLRSLKILRTFVSARREFIGGPTGGVSGPDDIQKIRGSGEDWLAERVVPFEDLDPPVFLAEEMHPYWKRDKPFGLPSRKRWMVVETSRGCPHGCNYCAIPTTWGNWQARPIQMLDEYLGYLKDMGIEELIVIDDNVALLKDRFISIIELFKKHGLYWSCSNGVYNRALLEQDVIQALRDSRCLYMSLPFETGNKRSADLMNLGGKYVDLQEARQIALSLRNLGIHTAGQFIIGYPGEDPRDVQETLDYANELELDERHIHIATPLKGTRMYEQCVENGYLIGKEKDALDIATYKTPVISTPMLPSNVLYRLWRVDREAALRRKETE